MNKLPEVLDGGYTDRGYICRACGPGDGDPIPWGKTYVCHVCAKTYAHPFPKPKVALPERHPLRLLVQLWLSCAPHSPKGMADLGLAVLRGDSHTRDELLYLGGAALGALPTPERDDLVAEIRANLSRVALKRLKVLRQRFSVVEHAVYVEASNDAHARALARELPEDAWKWHKEYNRPTEYLVDEFGLTDEEVGLTDEEDEDG